MKVKRIKRQNSDMKSYGKGSKKTRMRPAPM
jgi:hypothetical protein